MVKIPKVILIIENSREFGRGLLRGIAKYSRIHGPWIFNRKPSFFNTPIEKKKVLHQLMNWGADGIIMRDPQENPELVKMNLPAICFPYSREQIAGFPRINYNCFKIEGRGFLGLCFL